MSPEARVRSFDDLARGLANGSISRRKALKLTGSALLGGGLLALFPDVAGALAGCTGRPVINNKRCPETSCGGTPGCFCAETVGKRRVRQSVTKCVNFTNTPCPTRDECDSNSDCAGEKVCVKIGGCCGGSRLNTCARPC